MANPRTDEILELTSILLVVIRWGTAEWRPHAGVNRRGAYDSTFACQWRPGAGCLCDLGGLDLAALGGCL